VLVLLVAARVDAACSAIRIRSELDGPLSDPAQEAVVIARAQVWAKRAGLSPTLAETIFRAVLTAGKERVESSRRQTEAVSKRAHEREAARTRHRAPARPSSPLSTNPRTPIPT
jgi:chorismate mutase